jgi:hypothetical protein
MPEGAVDEGRLVQRELVAVINDGGAFAGTQALDRIEISDAPGQDREGDLAGNSACPMANSASRSEMERDSLMQSSCPFASSSASPDWHQHYIRMLNSSGDAAAASW